MGQGAAIVFRELTLRYYLIDSQVLIIFTNPIYNAIFAASKKIELLKALFFKLHCKQKLILSLSIFSCIGF